MDVGTLLGSLAEKMSLIAAAALLAVLIPPLRNRLLGVGQRRDKLAAVFLGLALSIWGAMLGLDVMGEHMNGRAIGVLIAAILGRWKAGALAGLGGGLFYAYLVNDGTAPWVLIASVMDGVIAGVVAERRPEWFQGPRAFVTSVGIQGFHLVGVGLGLLAVGHAARYIPAWPAHLVKLAINAAGVTLFVMVARLVVSREESAVALVEARAAADAASLESLRRRLEPHFLFNALNALRATIRKDPVRARELVSDLSDLYRYLLNHPEDATLREEVSHAESYLAIERARLGDERISVHIDVDPEVEHDTMPALSLQPLVENAVRHGIAAHTGSGTVEIRASPLGNGLDVVEVVIEDHSAGERRGAPELDGTGSGIALETLRKRLAQRYGADASLTLEVEDAGARATLRLPRAGGGAKAGPGAA
ncbi:MAG: histidine kinase [Deltaproteobacteria bacterium]|nr:histidine kinase [Deltaproteobacteria bacterium]